MRDNLGPTYAKTNKENHSSYRSSAKSFEQGQLGLWKLVFLGVFALALSSVPLLGLFVATPLIMASIFYGRSASYLMSLVLMGILLVLSQTGLVSEGVSEILTMQFALMTFGSVVSVLVSEIILRGLEPAKGVFKAGVGIALVCFFAMGSFSALTGMEQVRSAVESAVGSQLAAFKADPQYQEFIKQGGEEALKIESALSATREISDEMLTWLPAAVAMTFFIAVWVALFLVLRNSLVWRAHFDYPYVLSDLVKVRLPDQVVWVLILGMGLALAGSSLENFSATVFGYNILYSLGILYFFQGFGIYLDFLTHLKISGLMRSLLVIFTVFMGAKVLAFIGVFDMWANFRRFFNNQNDNEGDIK